MTTATNPSQTSLELTLNESHLGNTLIVNDCAALVQKVGPEFTALFRTKINKQNAIGFTSFQLRPREVIGGVTYYESTGVTYVYERERRYAELNDLLKKNQI